jgi:hypothetical protein
MNKTKALEYINSIIAVLILSQFLTGLFHSMLYYKTFDVVHKGGGIILFIGVLAHVVLNWGWVKSTFLRR